MTPDDKRHARAIGNFFLDFLIQAVAPIALFAAVAVWVGLGLPFSLLHVVVLVAVICLLGVAFIRRGKTKRRG